MIEKLYLSAFEFEHHLLIVKIQCFREDDEKLIRVIDKAHTRTMRRFEKYKQLRINQCVSWLDRIV